MHLLGEREERVVRTGREPEVMDTGIKGAAQSKFPLIDV